MATYKAMKSTTRKYYKYNRTTFSQPILSSNGTYGTGNAFAVMRDSSNGGYRGGDAWYAFHTTSGYTSPYYVGNYGNEYSTTLNIYMWNPKPLVLTSMSFYNPIINSSSDWHAFKEGYFYGSNDGSTWTQLASHGGINGNETHTLTITNTNKFQYFRYSCTSYGSGHKDELDVSSIRLIGQELTKVETTQEQSEFYEDITEYKAFKSGTTYAVFKE